MLPRVRQRLIVALIVALFAVSAVSVVSTGLAGVPSSNVAPHAPNAVATPMPLAVPSDLQTAAASLAKGAAPTDGIPMACDSASNTALRCGLSLHALPEPHPSPALAHPVATARADARADAVHPAYSGTLAWYNQTSFMDGVGFGGPNYSQYDAAAAYDPNAGDVVLFGGCSFTCPTNDLWVWNGNEWVNDTPAYSPPAVAAESMAWDPAYNAIIMVGGITAGDALFNQTWELYEYNGSWFWDNLTFFVGSYGNEFFNGTAYASLAYDDALQELILVDGCFVANCSLAWSGTWALNNFNWTAIDLGPTGTNLVSGFLFGASMAYDRVSHEMVFFGGIDPQGNYTVSDYTYVLPTNLTWTNITSSSPSCFFVCDLYPEARYGASMTWDGELDDVVLVGGDTGTGLANDTWFFANGTWYTSGFLTTIPEPDGTYYSAMPVNCTDIAPVLMGGIGTGWFNNSWVLEAPPQPSFAEVFPSPSDAGVTVHIVTTNTRGDGSGPSLFVLVEDNYGNLADGYVGLNFSTTFDFAVNFGYTAGTWTLYDSETDFFGVSALIEYNLTVNPVLSVTITPTPDVTELLGGSASISFTSLPGGGTPTYSYLWNFGDGSTDSTLANVTHVYTSANLFDGWLNVTDSGGGYNNSSFAVLVFPALAETAVSNVTTTDPGTPVQFTGTPSGGSSVYDYTNWSFGDGSTATTDSATHTYAHPGTYTVYFNTTDSLNFHISKSFTVTVNAALAAIPVPTPGTLELSASPATVSFAPGVTGGTGPYTYLWNFGDGTATSTVAAPSHTYTTVGAFHGYVVVTDARGHFTNDSFTVNVETALSASVVGNVSTTEVGFPVQFTGTPSGGSAVYSNYSWQFGNGSTASYGAGPKAHTFTTAGTYEVHYNVTDSLSYKSSGTTLVKVYPALTASVSGNLTSADVGLSVKFTVSPSGGTGTYSTYTWTVGNGSTPSTGSATLSHTFTAAGTFEVYCNVTDSLGHTATSHKLISIAADPVGSISASTLSPHTGDTVTFTGTASSGTPAYTYTWQFGDGSTPVTTSTPTTTHSYSSAGNYQVNLTVTDSLGVKAVMVHLTVDVSSKASSPLGSLSSGTGLYALIGVIVVVLVVAALAVMLMRRRKKPSPAPASGGPPQAWSESTTPPSTGGSPPSGGSPPPGAQ